MNEENETQESGGLVAWDPNRYLRKVDPLEARLSRGFLRCRPEKWFPGFSAYWLPLAHSLGVDIKILEVKPVMAAPSGLQVGFAGTIDDEPLAIFIEDVSGSALLETVIPGGSGEARSVVSEYLARRLLTSLANSWSGPESSVVRFDSELDVHSIRYVAGVKFTISLNGSPCSIWILAGKLLVERMDGLWRRQLHASSREQGNGGSVHLEIAHLTVPPSMLSDYVKSGTTIDLEVVLTDQIILSANGKSWLPARLCSVEGAIAFEVVGGGLPPQQIPEGTTRLSIEFGSVELDPASVVELSQVGAIYTTPLQLGAPVEMRINGELVGRANLSSYEGRFAISVL